MRILLDECMPLRLAESAVFSGHQVEHVTGCGLAGLPNGDLHAAANGRYDLLVTTDRHFTRGRQLAPTPTMGIVCVRVTPNVLEFIVPALEAVGGSSELTQLIGKLTIVWRDRWETR